MDWGYIAKIKLTPKKRSIPIESWIKSFNSLEVIPSNVIVDAEQANSLGTIHVDSYVRDVNKLVEYLELTNNKSEAS